jgi:glucose-6-phosphate 1-epimerase
VTVNGEVDRIYMDVGNELVIDDAGYGRKIHIVPSGSNTAVVWNPWSAISKSSADLQDDDYQRFLCVETANAGKDIVQVQAGSEYRLGAEYRIE